MAVTIALEDASSVLDLRQTILRSGRPPEESVYPTDGNPLTAHVVARDESGGVVGIGSVAVDPAPSLIETVVDVAHQWRLRGMATSESVRGTGVGRQVLARAMVHAKSNGAELVWCNARAAAAGFYEHEGWVKVSELFDLPIIGPHYVMREDLRVPEHSQRFTQGFGLGL